jgi:N-methylhydantoinase B/oxoprolinase/acetone carboxylase alpha subunit
MPINYILLQFKKTFITNFHKSFLILIYIFFIQLNAQIAANQKGIGLLKELVQSYGLPVVQAYMAHIQLNAEQAVRQLLRRVAKENRELKNAKVLYAIDTMDDGTQIKLAVEIDEKTVGFKLLFWKKYIYIPKLQYSFIILFFKHQK